jgi:hypothetical protein
VFVSMSWWGNILVLHFSSSFDKISSKLSFMTWGFYLFLQVYFYDSLCG